MCELGRCVLSHPTRLAINVFLLCIVMLRITDEGFDSGSFIRFLDQQLLTTMNVCNGEKSRPPSNHDILMCHGTSTLVQNVYKKGTLINMQEY